MSNIATLEHRPQLVAGARPTAIVPTDMDSCYRLAKAVCMAGMAPRGLDTPEKAMVAIMHGLECGLTPMAALQRIAVVNGRPVIWGDGAIGLVRGSGLCEFIDETIEGEGDNRVAICETKRRGETRSVIRSFSVADAKKARLWGKQGPWQDYPERMLQMRARAFALRDGFADVLGGIYIKEEVEDDADRRPLQSSEPPIPVQSVEPPIPAAFIEHVAKQPEPPIPDANQDDARKLPLAEKLRAAVDAAVAAKDVDALEAAWDEVVTPHVQSLIKEEYEQLQAIYAEGERAFDQ